MNRQTNKVSSSYKDPSGFVFTKNNLLFRQINKIYQPHYEKLIKSGLYKDLVSKNLLIPHKETTFKPKDKNTYKVIKPDEIPFLSYPYEWSFDMLKDAALTTLQIQKTALGYGMTLKDASGFNIQFLEGRPIFIDTLSFEIYPESKPWTAYRQFCRHFLAPLTLMTYKDIGLNRLLRIYLDGIPLDLTSKLLPFSSRLNLGILSHIHLNALAQKSLTHAIEKDRKSRVDKKGLLAILDNLYNTISNLKLSQPKSAWSKYYQDTNYTKQSFESKKKFVASILSKIKPKTLWDLGANIGEFSYLASRYSSFIVAMDIDPLAVNNLYQQSQGKKNNNILPLVMDLANPSPSLGWENCERDSLTDRGPADTALALALVHHLTITYNLPFEKIASYFSKICKNLIIEFVPKEDTRAHSMIAAREDIFADYNEKNFLSEFGKYFRVLKKYKIPSSKRSVFWMKVK